MPDVFVLDDVFRSRHSSIMRTDIFVLIPMTLTIILTAWRHSCTQLPQCMFPALSHRDSTRTPSVLPAWLVSPGRQIFRAIESRHDLLKVWLNYSAVMINHSNTNLTTIKQIIGSMLPSIKPPKYQHLHLCGGILQHRNLSHINSWCVRIQFVYRSWATKNDVRPWPNLQRSRPCPGPSIRSNTASMNRVLVIQRQHRNTRL